MYVFAILKRFSIFLLWKFLFSLCLSYINYSFIREQYFNPISRRDFRFLNSKGSRIEKCTKFSRRKFTKFPISWHDFESLHYIHYLHSNACFFFLKIALEYKRRKANIFQNQKDFSLLRVNKFICKFIIWQVLTAVLPNEEIQSSKPRAFFFSNFIKSLIL